MGAQVESCVHACMMDGHTLQACHELCFFKHSGKMRAPPRIVSTLDVCGCCRELSATPVLPTAIPMCRTVLSFSIASRMTKLWNPLRCFMLGLGKRNVYCNANMTDLSVSSFFNEPDYISQFIPSNAKVKLSASRAGPAIGRFGADMASDAFEAFWGVGSRAGLNDCGDECRDSLQEPSVSPSVLAATPRLGRSQ